MGDLLYRLIRALSCLDFRALASLGGHCTGLSGNISLHRAYGRGPAEMNPDESKSHQHETDENPFYHLSILPHQMLLLEAIELIRLKKPAAELCIFHAMNSGFAIIRKASKTGYSALNFLKILIHFANSLKNFHIEEKEVVGSFRWAGIRYRSDAVHGRNSAVKRTLGPPLSVKIGVDLPEVYACNGNPRVSSS
jgi:hypothetical protein